MLRTVTTRTNDNICNFLRGINLGEICETYPGTVPTFGTVVVTTDRGLMQSLVSSRTQCGFQYVRRGSNRYANGMSSQCRTNNCAPVFVKAIPYSAGS